MIVRKKKQCIDCGEHKILFGKSLCQSCYRINNFKPIKKVSEKRKVENKEYTVKRLKFLTQSENLRCPITGQKATEVHHTYCGKDRAKYYLDSDTWLAVSRDGHNWIHDNPAESREKGYLK